MISELSFLLVSWKITRAGQLLVFVSLISDSPIVLGLDLISDSLLFLEITSPIFEIWYSYRLIAEKNDSLIAVVRSIKTNSVFE
jgi:hypothetical protein